jgi:hypothetical protein
MRIKRDRFIEHPRMSVERRMRGGDDFSRPLALAALRVNEG